MQHRKIRSGRLINYFEYRSVVSISKIHGSNQTTDDEHISYKKRKSKGDKAIRKVCFAGIPDKMFSVFHLKAKDERFRIR